jgi:hypothetical protein
MIRRAIFVAAAMVIACIARMNGQTQTVVGTESGGVGTLSVSEATLIAAIEEDFNDGTEIASVYIEGQSGVYYLVGVGDKNGNCVRRGYLLNEDSGGNFRMADAYHHTCSGVCCTSCGFTKDSQGNINGCQCNTAAGGCGTSSYCNHIVSTLTTGGYIGSFY